jgi:hypothetical protein
VADRGLQSQEAWKSVEISKAKFTHEHGHVHDMDTDTDMDRDMDMGFNMDMGLDMDMDMDNVYVQSVVLFPVYVGAGFPSPSLEYREL